MQLPFSLMPTATGNIRPAPPPPLPWLLPLAAQILLLLTANVGTEHSPNGRREIYHNQFAVHIQGGSEERATALAAKYGFVNLGQIGALQDHYLFEHHKIHKRSIDYSPHHNQMLTDEPDVAWFEQQKEIKRVKRDTGGSFIMPDPLFKYQWFLNHGAQDQSDMNVQPAWKKGYTGQGVVVTILDDGIQTNHPDLKRNYDPKASSDINSNDDDPMPQDNGDNKHGTRCAGEVAAEAFNDVCGVGIAFNASIGGVRMLDGMVNDAVEARALSLNPQHIDIYSASWGPEDDGKTVDGPGPLAKKAFIEGVKFGRGGRGSIFVWASGNGGRKVDNCNCDGYTNSIFTLSISSASQGGRKPWYLEECSSTLATTYSSGTPSHDDSITTVDQDAKLRPEKLCTSYHTGTSASAPIAAGVCALALEANPNLGWRDMQHIVVLTSNPTPLHLENGWQTNGVGRQYSHKFGYGLMDADEMVELASVWPGVGRQRICETAVQRPNTEIPDNSNSVARVTSRSDGCHGTEKEINYLEHVQCKISLKYNPRGALHIVLTSPAGTKSSLLLPRPKDKTNGEFRDWPFLSVHFWGERPNGTWTLEVYRSPTAGTTTKGRGVIKEWKLMFYGTRENVIGDLAQSPDMVIDELEEKELLNEEDEKAATPPPVSIPDEVLYANKTLIEENSETGPDGCNLQCAPETGCFGPGPNNCAACKSHRFGHICLGECPKRTFTTTEMTCHACSHSCETCFGPESNQCLSCSDDTLLLADTSVCVDKCPFGYRMDSSQKNTCQPCPENCESCTETVIDGVPKVICVSCFGNLVISSSQTECLDECPAGYYTNAQTRKCDICDSKCETCIGPLATQCSICKPGTFYYHRQCVEICPQGFHEDLKTKECLPCPTGCAKCDQDQACSQCNEAWAMNATSGQCYPKAQLSCPVPSTFLDPQGNCRPCHESCDSCEGGSGPDSCLSCQGDHFLHIGTCIDQCPKASFAAAGTKTCRHCPHACKTCTSPSSCTSCHKGYVFNEQGQCVANCPLGKHQVEGHCKACHANCKTCKGLNQDNCLSCPPGRVLSSGQCLETCPEGYYPSKDFCLPCHSSCQSCSGGDHTQCNSCHQGMKLSANACISCPPGQFYHEKSSKCTQCHQTCSSCSGPTDTECTACSEPLQLDPWNKTCVLCCQRVGDRRCCQCNATRDKCIRPARSGSSTKRSFREDVGSSSRSAFFFFCVVAAVALVTIFVLKSYGRRKFWRRKWGGGDKSSGGRNGVHSNGAKRRTSPGKSRRRRDEVALSEGTLRTPLIPLEEFEENHHQYLGSGGGGNRGRRVDFGDYDSSHSDNGGHDGEHEEDHLETAFMS